MSWVVFILVPVLFIAIFWMLHILPEKFAHKRNHPQADAIHVLCMLSLFFGGLLWPLAMIWAFMKPPRLQVEPVPAPAGPAPSADHDGHAAPSGSAGG